MHSVGCSHYPNLQLRVNNHCTSRRATIVRPVKCVQQQQHAGQVDADQQRKQAVLCTKFKAHDASVTALAVLRDEPGFKQIVTASLDKSLAIWTLEGGDLSGPQLQCSRLDVAGGPVFSLQRGIKSKVTDANVKPQDPVLFCGLASKEITALRPDTLTFSQQMRMNGHTGWVRSLASSGKYLFSCGCNHLHQWDQAYAVPKEVRSMSLFTGDILALAATDKAVFTAGADGSLRRWALGKLGELAESDVRDKAHDGRITALAVSGSLLFSAGYDGALKAWDINSLQLVMEVKAAHAGERLRSLAVGSAPPSSSAQSSPVSSSSSPAGTPTSSPPPSPLPSHDASTASLDCQVQPQPEPHPEPEPEPEPEPQPQQQWDRLDEPLCDTQQGTQQPQQAAAAPEGSLCEATSAASTSPEALNTAAAPAVHRSSRPGSPSNAAVLYSAGDDGLVRRWDARLLSPLGEPLQVHHSAVKALAVGDKEVLVSGDSSGEVAVWLL